MPTIDSSETLVLVTQQNGLVIIPSSTPLTRLNYFDGKFLRATDLQTEQEYLRQLVAQSNQASGSGVARGFDLTLGSSGDTLTIGAGLAIDPGGRVLLLPQSITVNTQELIDKSRELQASLARSISAAAGAFETCESTSMTRPANLIPASDLYLIVLSQAEALCGEEDVFGKLCEEACATSTDRPYLLEGVIVRAIPLVLGTPLPTSTARPLTATHLRSRVASAYFEDERRVIASLISRAGLALQTWCLGANPAAGSGVPIGVIARAGATTVFLDAWTARRELINTGAERYWRWRMMMRPWDVFLAQILQFQCQLRDLFRSTPVPAGDVDPCGGALGAVNQAAAAVTEFQNFFAATTQRFADLRVTIEDSITFTGGSTRLASLGASLAGVSQALAAAPRDSVLINGGIVELPSAGYLPVVPGAGATINQQVHQLMGDGVDLRFCIVRHDYVAHALEEAQHMERISLIYGLDHPEDKPKVDILVPYGEILEVARTGLRNGFETQLTLLPLLSGLLNPPADRASNQLGVNSSSLLFNGVTRMAVLPGGGGAVYSAGFVPPIFIQPSFGSASPFTLEPIAEFEIGAVAARSGLIGDVTPLPVLRGPSFGYWLELNSDKNVFAMSQNEVSSVSGRAIIASSGSVFVDIHVWGQFRVTTPGASAVTGQLSVMGVAILKTGTSPTTTQAKPFDLLTTVVLSGGSTIGITVQGVPGKEFFFSANWSQNPITADAGVTTGSSTSRATGGSNTGASFRAATSELRPNPDVYQVTNVRHGQAIAGLQVVGSALADAGFVNTASNLLFPPLAPASNELIVRGTRDWVLFHRRRDKQCAVEVKAPPMAPPRKYAVYHLALTDDGGNLSSQLAGVKAWLNGDDISSRPFVPVTDVEFQSGVAALISDPAAIRNDWSAKNPGKTLLYGAIASTTAAATDGDDLALSRLAQIEMVVSSISPPAATILSELLPEVPRTPVVAGPDGVIVLVTATPTVCHTVARILPGVLFDVVRNLAQAGTFSEIFPAKAEIVSNVVFNAGTDSVVGTSLTDIVSALAPFGNPLHTFGVGAPGALLDATWNSQVNKIVTTLGGSPPMPGVLSQHSLPTPCPAITFIEFSRSSSGGCITPSEMVILAPGPTTAGVGGQGTGTVKITNNFDFDFEIQTLVAAVPFSVITPTNRTVLKKGSVDVTVNYIRTRTDGQDDIGKLAMSVKFLGSPFVSFAVCPPTNLIGRRQSSAFDTVSSNVLVADKSAQQVQPKADVPAAKSKITKAKTNTARAKPAAARRKRKK